MLISKEDHNLPIPDEVNELLKLLRNTEQNHDQINPKYFMQIMAHPVTPIVGSILFLAGIAICASGICLAGVGAVFRSRR